MANPLPVGQIRDAGLVALLAERQAHQDVMAENTALPAELASLKRGRAPAKRRSRTVEA